ncbi:hypothetical protein EDB83DRAFT_2168957, partial [Lactarius deliciosus]
FTKDGNVHATKAFCTDSAMWEIGGVAVPLRLIQTGKVRPINFARICLAVPHRHRTNYQDALCIHTDGLRNSWQNSEVMECMRGYEILSDILRKTSELVNITSYEILFEFLGINFKTPESILV